MRGLSVIAGCCLFWTQLALAAEQDFPYTAYISQDGTAIRCAAGRNYYATDQLKRGEMVEVHEHSKDGWCAIRPPEGSFSWVLADSLRVDSDGIGIVLHDKTPCRVGSSVTDLWDVIQVRLSRAEEVEVLDAVLRELKKDDKIENSMWCKIAPPSGEFRWVEAASLSRETPATVLASNSDDQLEKRNDNTSTKPAERNADPAPATVVDTAVSRADRWELDS
ncbi:MAG: SH3 domain-containing protein, partial [Planctomycetota bacterium]|nr:SH3 domain-containing protein [Planctomycetota bacterium]